MSVTNEQVNRLFREHDLGASVGVASMRAGMSARTGAKFLRLKKMPSELKTPRAWRTRDNPFEQDWKEIGAMLAQTPDLQAKTIFDVLNEQHPGRYSTGQLRTLQRHIRRWHVLQGDDKTKNIFFPQVHVPGEAMQGDFTHTGELSMTMNGLPFKPLLCHNVLPYSKWQWATRCVSESILSLRCGIQDAVFRLQRITEFYQTDNSTGATHRVGSKRVFNADYLDLTSHLGMKPRTTAIGAKEQNGSVEALNDAFKRLLEQRLLIRGSRKFDDEAQFDEFLHDTLERANRTCQSKLEEELKAMRPLVASRTPEYKEFTVKVSTYSTINICQNIYSVPPRLTRQSVRVRVYEQRIEVRYADQLVMTAQRMLGRSRHHINYRHVIWSLVRKPGAFARYRYREDLFISPGFKRAYDALQQAQSGIAADSEYLRILHLAASTMQCDVEAAIELILEQKQAITADAVKELVTPKDKADVPTMQPFQVDLKAYDQVLARAIK